MNYPAQIIVNVLHREFPDLAIKVINRIREQLPDSTFHNLEIIEGIVDTFCQVMGVTKAQLYNAEMIKSNTHMRRILIGVIMKLYQPELIVGMIDGYMDSNITKQLILILKISRVTISFDVKRSIKFYQLYSDFKEEVDNIYNIIIEQYGTEKVESTAKAI
ncbi:hypothetical protein [Sphingobacterium anhuiense]|uniref:hypothetical protein n=1 Tax=Sphingobacterium anhuiense TaxID=493780 RepID=UPI003C309D0C